MNSGNLSGGPHNAVLFHAVMSYLTCDLASADPRVAKAFGVEPKIAKRLMDLTTSDMMQLARRGSHCIKIQVDPEALNRLFETLDQENSDQDLINECISLDASREMMVDLFRLSHRGFALKRQMLGLHPGNGRRKECSIEDAERIYDAWTKHECSHDVMSLIAIAKELDLPLRLIWDELPKYMQGNGKVANSRRQRVA